MARKLDAAHRAASFADAALGGDDAAIVHQGFERNILDGRGQDASVNAEELAGLADGSRKIAGDLTERGQEQIAHAVAAQAAAHVKTKLKRAGDGRIFVRERGDTTANIAGGKNAVVAAEAAGAAAVIGDGDDGSEFGNREVARLAGNGSEIAKAVQDGGKSSAAAERNDAAEMRRRFFIA